MSDYLKELQDRAAKLSSDWRAAESRAAARGVAIHTNELLELRGRTAEVRAEIESRENGRSEGTPGLRMSDLTPQQREDMAFAQGARSASGGVRGESSAAEDSPESRDWTNFLRTGAAGPEFRIPTELRAAGEATGAAGGYLVPPGWWQRLQVALKAYGGTSNYFQEILTESGQPMQWATVNPTAVVGSLISENTQISNVDYTFGQGTIGAYMYTSGVQLVSFQLANDSAFNIDAFVTARVAESLGRAQAAAAISGTGSGQPLGVITALAATSGMTSGGTYSLTAGTKVNTLGPGAGTSTTGSVQVTELTAGTLSPASYMGMVRSVDRAYRDLGARWFFNDATLLAARSIVDGYGRPYYESLQDDTNPMLLGYPVTIDNSIPALTASTASGVLFGHMPSAMALRKVNQGGVMRLEERWADYLQVGFIGYTRFDIRSNDLRAAVVAVPAAT